ncbi:MAG: hypothetical protein ACRDQW_15245 [Haloechinothrix sp.]
MHHIREGTSQSAWARWAVPFIRNNYTRAVGIYVAAQIVALVALAILAEWHDRDLLDRLTAWDGQWYLGLAEHGYDGLGEGFADSHGEFTPGVTPLAFFPLYPRYVWLTSTIPGISTAVAALLASWVAGVVAACGIFRIGRIVDPRPRVGLLLVALSAGAPMAITMSMAYTEAVFIAFAAWALAFALERHWIAAGLCCLLAGFTRSTASILIAVVVVTAMVALWQGRDRRRALACILLCPVGLLGYWGYVAVRTGSLTGWSEIESSGWDTRFDFGSHTIPFAVRVVATGSSVMEVGAVLCLIAAGVLVVLCALQRLPWQLTAYAAGVFVLVVGMSGIPAGKPRFLLPAAFVLLLPVAMGLAGRRRSTMIAGAVVFVAIGAWFSAYSLTGWPYAI